MYYQLIRFYRECKNQEMPLCIKYLNRKGIEVRDVSSKKKKKKKKKKKNSIRSNFLVEELIFERSSRQYFFSWRQNNIHILEACTGIMWLR